MHLSESTIEAYLACKNPTEFSMEYLESDIAATTTLRRSQVVTISCYRSGVHDFLLFELFSMGKTFWMRFDRMPGGIRRKAIFWSFKQWPAEDSYSMNYNRNTLLPGEDKMPQLVELLSGLSNRLSMHDISGLMAIVRGVSTRWTLRETNCRWFCAITLNSLQRHFGGTWMVSALHNGIAQWRGFDNSATRSVEEIYRPRYLNTAFQAINIVSMAVVDTQQEEETSSVAYRYYAYPLESLPTGSTEPPLNSPRAQGTAHNVEKLDLASRATIFAHVSNSLEPAVNEIISISPESTAELLKYMEIEIRSKYLQSEIVGLYAVHHRLPGREIGQSLAPFSEILSIWIKSCVVFADNIGVRAMLIKHFVKVAKNSCNRRNYSTTLSIVEALSELEIRKITQTFSIVGEKTVAKIEKMRVDSHRHIKQVPIHACAVLPLKSSGMIARFDELRSDPQASSETNNLAAILCPREVLEAHRMLAEPMGASLNGCYSLLLDAMKSTAQKWDEAGFSARLAALHLDLQPDHRRIGRL